MLLCFGHRGAAGYETENSLASVKKAIALGVDWIEIDIHAVHDELFVFHDFRLERLTAAKGYLRRKSLRSLARLRLPNGEPIPTLSEVMNCVNHRVGVNIEIKNRGCPRLLAILLDRLVREQYWPEERILVSSFVHRELGELKHIRPQTRIGLLTPRDPLPFLSRALSLKAFSIYPNIAWLSPALVSRFHDNRLRVYTWTVNEPQPIRRSMEMGVDGIISDFPDRVLTARSV